MSHGFTERSGIRTTPSFFRMWRQASCASLPMEALRKSVAAVADISLEEYHVDAIHGGTDALVDVTVRLSKDGKIITSRGARTDIIMASVEAVVAGMNRLLREEHEDRSKNPD